MCITPFALFGKLHSAHICLCVYIISFCFCFFWHLCTEQFDNNCCIDVKNVFLFLYFCFLKYFYYNHQQLPSPDASDNEDIRSSSVTHITMPYFCNKLREISNPLFQQHHDCSTAFATLHENVIHDRSRATKVKKRNNKGKVECCLVSNTFF